MKNLLLLSLIFLLFAAPSFGAVACDNEGALAANNTTTTLAIVSAASGWATGDILIAAIIGKDNQVITVPGAQGAMGAWTNFGDDSNTANQRFTMAWARATGADANGDTFNFTKPTDNNILFAGVIFKCTGAVASGSPIDATTYSVSPNASSDTVTYATFDPTETSAYLVALGFYNNDNTTAGAIAGTDPSFSNIFDLETATGTDASVFGYFGINSGAATGARSHSTTSTADDVNIGVIFGLKEEPPPGGGGPIAFVNSCTAGSTDGNTFTTGNCNMTGANFFVACVSSGASPTPTITDSSSNTWTARTPETAAATHTIQSYDVANATATGTHNFTLTCTACFPSIVVLGFSGVKTSGPFDMEDGTSSAASADLTIPSITPSENDTVVASCLSSSNGGNDPTINGGFSTPVGVQLVGGQHYAGFASYLIQGTAAASSPTWADIGGSSSAGWQGSYKSSDGAVATGGKMMTLGVGQ